MSGRSANCLLRNHLLAIFHDGAKCLTCHWRLYCENLFIKTFFTHHMRIADDKIDSDIRRACKGGSKHGSCWLFMNFPLFNKLLRSKIRFADFHFHKTFFFVYCLNILQFTATGKLLFSFQENAGLVVPWLIGILTFISFEALGLVYANVLKDQIFGVR